ESSSNSSTGMLYFAEFDTVGLLTKGVSGCNGCLLLAPGLQQTAHFPSVSGGRGSRSIALYSRPKALSEATSFASLRSTEAAERAHFGARARRARDGGPSYTGARAARAALARRFGDRAGTSARGGGARW